MSAAELLDRGPGQQMADVDLESVQALKAGIIIVTPIFSFYLISRSVLYPNFRQNTHSGLETQGGGKDSGSALTAEAQ